MPAPEVRAEASYEQESPRDRRAREIRSDVAFEHAEDDSLGYVAFSTGIRSLLLSGLKASTVIERELTIDDARAEGDEKKLSQEERRSYEEYLTEVHSWTFLLPHLLCSVRIVQHDADVAGAMKTATDDIAKVLTLGESLEKARMGIVFRSQIDTVGRTTQELASIATFKWLERMKPRPKERVVRDSALLKEHLKSIGILQQQEHAYAEGMVKTEASHEDLRAVSDTAKTVTGTKRVTQGFPGAEMLLDRPEVTLGVWRRLLLEGGPRETKNGAKKLGDAVAAFREEFLEKKALVAFERQLDQFMRGLLVQNALEQEKSKRILGFLLGDFGEATVDRLTTHPEEFEAVKEAIVANVRSAFDAVATPANAATCQELADVLRKMEEGAAVDTARLSLLIEEYVSIQTENRDVMAGVQRWQVAENAARVGGRGAQMRHEQMIDQATRLSDGTSGIEWMRRLAPYGSFQTRGYVSPDGRRVLLPPSEAAFSNSGPFGHMLETGKLVVEPVLAAPLFASILYVARVPLAGPGGVVLAAELQQAMVKGGAHADVVSRHSAALATIINDLRAVERGTDLDGKGLDPRLRRDLARQAGDRFFGSFLTVLQASKASVSPLASERSSAAPRPVDVLEAHVYTNQLLNAFGFPGYHQMPDGMAIPAHDDPSLSPEARAYIDSRSNDRESKKAEVRRATHEQLARLRLYEDRLLGAAKHDGSQEKSRALRMLEGTEIPSSRALQEIRELMESSEFVSRYQEFAATAKRADVLAKVGSWLTLKSTITEASNAYYHPTGAQRIGRFFTGSKPTLRECVGEEAIATWRPSLDAVQKTTLLEFLQHVKFLQENPPTNAEISGMYRNAGISGIGDSQIDRFFGPAKSRDVTERLLTTWLELKSADRAFPAK